jgi:hypothetical protein
MADKEINTNGGSFIGEDVNIGSGDFIGRDKINTTSNTGNVTTTSNTYLSGNFLVAVVAVIVVGITSTVAILRGGTVINTRVQSISTHVPKTTDTYVTSEPVSADLTLTLTSLPVPTQIPDQQATANTEVATVKMETTVSDSSVSSHDTLTTTQILTSDISILWFSVKAKWVFVLMLQKAHGARNYKNPRLPSLAGEFEEKFAESGDFG